jgi:hypothetical protein
VNEKSHPPYFNPEPLVIRQCLASRSRVLVVFGELPPVRGAEDGGNYELAPALEPSNGRERAQWVEYDRKSNVAVIPNWIRVEVGDWIAVYFRDVPFFARVEGEFQSQSAIGVRQDRASVARHSVKAEVPSSIDPPNQSQRAPSPRSSRALTSTATPGLLVVMAGFIALVVLAVVAMLAAPTNDMGAIASAAFGVIGSVVGAFFGVHAGIGDRERVDRQRQTETKKVQMLATMMPEDSQSDARQVLREMDIKDTT